LAGIKFYDFATGSGGLFDGFKNGEAIESVGLAADKETAGLAIVRDFQRGG
jgi:hypothetical protein